MNKVLILLLEIVKDLESRWDTEALMLPSSLAEMSTRERCQEESLGTVSIMTVMNALEWLCKPESNILKRTKPHLISVLLKLS